MPFHLQIPRQLFESTLAHARAELPNECCGLLAGHVASELGQALVVRAYPLVNAAASPIEYLSDARSMFDAVRAMQREGLDVLAVYHSHPTSDPIPSRTDLERNYSEGVVSLIISLKSEPPQMRGWWLSAEGYREADWEIISA
jgi:proteasome lid subunit RPN8/RPN11